MEKEKPRLTRLTAIITQLQSKRIVTAREIAEKHKISIRTIYRDIRTLERSGIPILSEEGKGYSIQKGYRIPPVMFTEEEANALITAEKIINKNKDHSLVKTHKSAIEKIKSVLKYSQKEKSELLTSRIEIRQNHESSAGNGYLMQLQSAITNYQLVSFTYTSLQNKVTKRTVEPFALYSTQDNWILIAFCRLRNEFRAFRIDFIQDLISLTEVFTPHQLTLPQYFEICRKKTTTPDKGLTLSKSTFASNQKNKTMQTTQVEPFKVIGIKVRTKNHTDETIKDISGLWNKFFGEKVIQKIPNKINQDIYAIYTNYEGDHNQPYDMILGCKVNSLDEIPEGLIGQSFDGGKYNSLTTRGNLEEGLLYDTWLKIWDEDWDRKYTADFERYGAKAMNSEDAEVDVFVAVN